jgi:hypothetical protein
LAAPVDAPWAKNNASDSILGQTTYGQGSSFPSTFEANRLFVRTDQKAIYLNIGTLGSPVWEKLTGGAIFGDGSDGSISGTPSAPTKSFSQYQDVTITGNTSWNMAGYGQVVILVLGTLTINTSITWDITVDSPQDAIGGSSDLGSINGGTGRGGGGVIIMAKTVSAGSTSKIQIDSTTDGSVGTNSSTGGVSFGHNGEAHIEATQIGSFIGKSTRSYGEGAGRPDIAYDAVRRIQAGRGGLDVNVTNPIRYIKKVSDLYNLHSQGGSGGGGGGRGSTDSSCGGGGGGAGGSGAFANGGDGGAGGTGTGLTAGGAGAGGGGGAGCYFVMVTDSMDSDLELEANAGNGGNGGTGQTNNGNGGGGGGGGACVLLVAPTDLGTRDANGGSGGAAGAGTGTAAVAGTAGNSTSLFLDLDLIERK